MRYSKCQNSANIILSNKKSINSSSLMSNRRKLHNYTYKLKLIPVQTMNNAIYFLSLLHIVVCQERAMEPFIVGGSYADINKYPFVVYLEVSCLNICGHRDFWSCGAVILNQRMLLSAAHCLQGCEFVEVNDECADKIVAFMGSSHLKSVTIKRKITDAILHSKYNEVSMAHDITVAITRKDIPLGENLKRVILSSQFPRSGRCLAYKGFVAGWGIVNDFTHETTMDLKHVYQRLRSFTTCDLIGPLELGMFCAGSTDAKAEHPAHGDSGSGLVSMNRTHLMGVLSFHTRKYPALIVYTNATYYYNWIKTNTKRVFCRSTQ